MVIAGAGIFVVGAVGLELIEGWRVSEIGEAAYADSTQAMLTGAEIGEMVGAIVAMAGLLDLAGGVRVAIGGRDAEAEIHGV